MEREPLRGYAEPVYILCHVDNQGVDHVHNHIHDQLHDHVDNNYMIMYTNSYTTTYSFSTTNVRAKEGWEMKL